MSINTHLTDLASKLVLKDSEKESINTSIGTLQSRLDNYFSTVDDHFEFGSHTRGTILPRKADDNSDIDYMVVFSNTLRYKPQTFLNKLKDFANYYYSTSEVKQSHPTIVLELNHIKFELVPAYCPYAKDYRIPAPASDYSEWMATNPNGFNQELVNANTQNNYKIKPVVRLLKYWNALNGYVYSSYYLEKQIIGNFYFLCSSTKDYFKMAVDSLSESCEGMTETKRNKVQSLKKKIEDIYEKDANEMPYTAESDLKKILPMI